MKLRSALYVELKTLLSLKPLGCPTLVVGVFVLSPSAVGRSVSLRWGLFVCSNPRREGLLWCLGLSVSQEKLSQC